MKRNFFPSEKQLVNVSRRFELLLSFVAMFTAPFILFASQGFYTYLQKVSGLFSIPIFTIITIGFFNKKISPMAAKIGLLFFMYTYFICTYIFPVKLHFLHLLALLFVGTSLLMFLISYFWPIRPKLQKASSVVIDMPHIPWKARYWAAIVLLLLMIGIYWLFSPWGIATALSDAGHTIR